PLSKSVLIDTPAKSSQNLSDSLKTYTSTAKIIQKIDIHPPVCYNEGYECAVSKSTLFETAHCLSS
ncbi:hypothetical protein, partial [Selenomonas caprae]|uniref:hypothetical protein n=1 Tax=Selenomonas caprae TaxID=2606905 RepID=UPI001CA44021